MRLDPLLLRFFHILSVRKQVVWLEIVGLRILELDAGDKLKFVGPISGSCE